MWVSVKKLNIKSKHKLLTNIRTSKSMEPHTFTCINTDCKNRALLGLCFRCKAKENQLETCQEDGCEKLRIELSPHCGEHTRRCEIPGCDYPVSMAFGARCMIHRYQNKANHHTHTEETKKDLLEFITARSAREREVKFVG